MEDNYFDEKLRDIFENPPPFEADEVAIADMKRRLTEGQTKSHRGIAGLWWLLPLAFLPLLLGGFFFHNKYQNLNQKLDELNIQLTHFQQDTITKNYVTYHYDTIYKTIYKDVIIERHFEKSVVPPPHLGGFYNPYSTAPNLSRSPLTDFLRSGGLGNFGQKGFNSQNPFFQNESLLPENSDEQAADFFKNYSPENIGLLSLKTIKPYTRFNNLEEKLNDAEWETAEIKANPISYFIPKGINVGGNYMPEIRGKADTKTYSGKNFGIATSIEFHKGVELQIGLERMGYKYELKDPATFVNYPTLPPDNSGDFLAELKVNLSSLQIPLVFKKYFRNKKDIKPFVGVGIVAQKPLKQKFIYEYINGAIGEYKLNQTFNEGEFSINNVRANLGVRYHLSDHFSAQTELLYQHGFDQGVGEYFKLRYFGWNVGLRYHL